MSIEPKQFHVLIVDDDLGIRTILQEVLRYQGYSTRLAADGKAAYDLLEEGYQPDLILLDLMMPILNGWDFLDKQSQNPLHQSIPTIVISAVDGRDLPQRELRILRKPFGLEEVVTAVREVYTLKIDQKSTPPTIQKEAAEF